MAGLSEKVFVIDAREAFNKAKQESFTSLTVAQFVPTVSKVTGKSYLRKLTASIGVNTPVEVAEATMVGTEIGGYIHREELAVPMPYTTTDGRNITLTHTNEWVAPGMKPSSLNSKTPVAPATETPAITEGTQE